MNSKNREKSMLKKYIHNQLLLFLAIAISLLSPSSIISQPLNKQKFSEANIYSKKSFVTEAVERTGASVVTIDTQKFVKKKEIFKEFSTISRPIF